jgi:GntR family transcriptional regulator, rspAB operon transcriptional repressor
MADETKTDALFEVPLALGVHIFHILKEQIITGKLKEGARLNELALQKIFGTSRSPIREAFHRLETEDLVEITHRRGAFVRSISVQDVIEATAIRGCLEALALRIAPNPLSPSWLEELKQILRQMEEAKEKQDTEGFTSLHWRFHRAIIELSGNRILARIYPSVTEPFISDRLTYRFLKRPERFAGVGHQEIYDLLSSGQTLEAARLMEQHANAFVDYMTPEESGKTPGQRSKGNGKKRK